MNITEGLAGRQRVSAGAAVEAVAPVTFTVPTPPSVNGIFKNARRGRVKTDEYATWRATAVTAIRLQRVPHVAGRVVVLFGVERASLASDIDNRIKAMLDVIVETNVIKDDNLVTGFAAAWLPRANGLAHVQIFPADRLGIEFHPSKDGTTGGWYVQVPPQDGEPDGPVT